MIHSIPQANPMPLSAKRRTRTSRWLPLIWLLAIPMLNLIYSGLNNADRGVHSLVTDLDQAIPFIPGFIIPYLFWYVYMFGALALLAYCDLPLYGRTLGTLIVVLLASYAIYYSYQTTVPRPPITGTGAMSQAIPKAAKATAVLMSLLIIVSTFFLKQHVFMDAVGAIIVVELAQFGVRAAANIRKGELGLYGARNDTAR